MENLKSQQKIKEILVKNGYSEDYLEKKYYCDKCDDKGFVEGKKCSCLEKIIKEESISKLNKNSALSLSDFKYFDLSYYSNQKEEDKGFVPKEQMERVLTYCKNYAKKFSLNSNSIFMNGNTGLGKTHLSLAIAKEVVAKGYSVSYGSTQDFLREVEKEHFNREKNQTDTLQILLNTDLLVLDDLGAEFNSQFNVSTIHNIINTRINKSMPTIISSNLTTSELVNRYTDRVASRILTFDVIGFVGSDIRELKKMSKKL